jgi:cytoskeletal protein CcmA (bactofilin family)
VLAASYNLPADIGTGPFASCSGGGPTYNCSADVSLNNNDTVTLSADVTLNINGDFDPGKDVLLDNNGFVFNIIATGDINIDDRTQVNANLDAGGKIEFGKNVVVNGNVVSGDDIKLDDDVSITGNIDSGGKIDIGKRVVISGNLNAIDEIKIDDDANITGNIDSGGKIDIGKRAVINGDLDANDDIKIDKDVVINGDVTTTGNLDIGDGSLVNGTCIPAHPNCTGGPPPVGGNCDAFRDTFSLESYSNQDGTLNWQTDWNEVDDNGSPSGGDIRINTGELEFRGGGSGGNPLGGPYIEREADLSAYTTATLTFDYRESGNWEPSDQFEVYVSSDGGSSWTLIQTFTDDQGGTFQPFTYDITTYIATNTRIAFVEKADSNGERFYLDNVQIEGCVSVAVDHFRITPATTNASTCLPNAITIVAEDVSNMPISTYTGTVNISTSTDNGNWSVNDADNVTSPNPDNDDNGAVDYSFLLSDIGEIILDLSSTHAETLTISVVDASAAVTSTSVAITFSDNVFIITEDPVQVAGRPQAMNIAMWTNDGANCFIDTNYNYNPQNLEASINRGGMLPGANDPNIGAVTIPDGPAIGAISLDFSVTPGQAGFILDTNDVGQYTLTISDTTNTHSAGVITGSSTVLTVRPFGIAVNGIMAGATPNPGGTAPADPIFTLAGGNFEAMVAGVLWSAADDTDNDGVLDTGVYANNSVAPSYAWDTTLAASLVPLSFTPSSGAPGVVNNGIILLAEFGGGSFNVTDLQYTEVGSFTLQSSATDFLGEPTADIVGDDIIVGRFIPASFAVTINGNGILGETCSVFTYMGQDFNYDTAPTITVTAQNALGATTAQYRDVFVKLNGTSVSVDASQDDTTAGSDTNPLLVSYTAAVMALSANNDGTVDYTFGADTFRYGPDAPLTTFSKAANSQVAPFVADINPEISAVSDGEVTTNYAAGTHVLDPTGNNLRFGRLRMDNVFGPELNPLLMPVFTEFWNGTGFQKNILDTCTTIANADLISVASPPGLSVPAVVNAPASAGDVNLSFPSPGAGNDGFIDTITDLNSAAHLWLRFDWDADGVFDNDPFAQATFGIFDGNPVQIYIQQIYE